MGTAAVLRFDGDHPGLAADLSGDDRHLLTVQFATVETCFLALDIRQRTDTAIACYPDIRRLSADF